MSQDKRTMNTEKSSSWHGLGSSSTVLPTEIIGLMVKWVYMRVGAYEPEINFLVGATVSETSIFFSFCLIIKC